MKIRRALISVSDKTGLIPFAKALCKHKVEILSTGGTLKALKDAGVAVKAVDEFTGFPEILEGRVKTLHPKIHGGLLFRRDKDTHKKQAESHGIEPIDLVVVNLYPFEEVVSRKGVKLEDAIENIDIGGPSMLRSAAKNYDAVTVVCDPSDYAAVMVDIQEHKGKVSDGLKKQLALKVFQRTSTYDQAIASFLAASKNGSHKKTKEKPPLPPSMNLGYKKVKDLRYGENPHQRAAWYLPGGQESELPFEQLHGKELSFNNLLDIEAAISIVAEFSEPAGCVIKHSNPSGVAQAKNVTDALDAAIECDPMSAFGGILGINRPCDIKTAEMAFEALRFFEVFVAPSFESDAIEYMKKRPNLRLIQLAPKGDRHQGSPGCLSPMGQDFRFLQSGLLVQDRDEPLVDNLKEIKKNLKFVTKTQLSAKELEDMLFAFKCVKVVKSNAIVITQGKQTVGIGAGQMSRVDSVTIACSKAGERTKGGILASDAFFPMPDSIEVAHRHGIRAIIQPGGSVKDQDVINACDKFGIAMAFTGQRHFRH